MTMKFNSHFKYLSILIVFISLLLQGCATRVKANFLNNPPPSEAFSNFSHIKLNPTVGAKNKRITEKAIIKIQENLEKELGEQLIAWNQQANNGRTLTITPIIEELELTHTASRVLFGPLAGSSGINLRLDIRDETGREIASPEFFQRADAWAAGYVFGVHDNLMITRVAAFASRYIKANYQQAIGGPTGADTKAIQ